jgi:hypothetical protein
MQNETKESSDPRELWEEGDEQDQNGYGEEQDRFKYPSPQDFKEKDWSACQEGKTQNDSSPPELHRTGISGTEMLNWLKYLRFYRFWYCTVPIF